MKRLQLIAFLCFICSIAQAQVLNNSVGVPSSVPFTGFSLLAKSGVSASVTGTTSETALATITIPANAIGPNGQIKINCYWTETNNADTKTLRVRLSGIGGTAIFSNGSITTVGNVWSYSILTAANATNSQSTFSEAARGTDGLVTTTFVSSAIDMTQSQTLVITGQLGVGTDTITLNGYTVEYAF